MRHRIVDTIVFATIVLLLSAACTSSNGSGERATDPDAALRGGTLRMAVPDDWNAGRITLDPAAYQSHVWELSRCCLSRALYSYNGSPAAQGGAEVRPDLAQGMPEVSSDGLTWRFRLKPGLRYAPPFEDTPIVVHDIVRALEREARLKGESYDQYFSPIRGFDEYPKEADSIVGLETPDDRTLVVRLEGITGDLAHRLALPATAPIPEGASAGHDKDYGRFLVASGPYMVEGSEDLDFSVPPGEQEPASGFAPARMDDSGEVVEEPGSLVLVRNPSWEPESDGLRPAYPDRIEIAIGVGDHELLAERVDAAELDLVYSFQGSPAEQVARYREDPALEDRLHVHERNDGFSLQMNLAMPPFDDVHVRRAVSYAIDKAALVDLLSEPPYGPGGSGTGVPGTHNAPDTIERGLLRAFDPYPYDLAAAREEMRASAYDRNGDGVCDVPACRDVRTLVMPYGSIHQQAEGVRDDLAEIGIELELETHPTPLYGPREHIPIVFGEGWGFDYPEGTGWFLAQFDVSGLEGSNSWLAGSNASLLGASAEQLRDWGYEVTSVPSVEDRLEACQQRRGVARTQCWAEYDQYLMNEVVPRVFYMYMDRPQAVSERVVEYSFDGAGPHMPALDRIALAPGSD